MKLDAVNVALIQDRRKRNNVIARGRRGRDDRTVVTIREIEIRSSSGPAQQAGFAAAPNLVPPHVRNAQFASKAPYLAFINLQAALFVSLLAGREQSLKTQANPQKRDAGANSFHQRLADLQFVKRPHHLAEMPDAGKNDFRCAAQTGGIAD